MKTWIVLDGETDLTIVKALLPDEIQSTLEFIVVGERSNVSSIACTVLVKHKEPVVVLTDAESLEPRVIRDQYSTLDYLLRSAAGGTPCKLILCIPTIEAIFFSPPNFLERIFPKWHQLFNLMYFTKLPNYALVTLLEDGSGPTTIPKLLAALTEDEIEHLRTKGPLRDLLDFVLETNLATDRQVAS